MLRVRQSHRRLATASLHLSPLANLLRTPCRQPSPCPVCTGNLFVPHRTLLCPSCRPALSLSPSPADSQDVCGAGEATVFEGKLYLDNNSGTAIVGDADFSAQALNTQLGGGEAAGTAGAGPDLLSISPGKVRSLDCFEPSHFVEYCRAFAGARAGGKETPYARDVAKCAELPGGGRKVS